MQLTNISQQMTAKIDTAVAALRRGSMVMIRDQNGRAGFAQAAEFADFELPEISALKKIVPTLCLTKQHIAFFRPETSSDRPVFSLTANSLTKTQILGLSIGEAQLLPKNTALLPEHSNSLADLAVKIVKFAKLLPSSLLYRLPTTDMFKQERLFLPFQAPILEFSDIDNLSNIQSSLSVSIKADLPLKKAPDSKIIMFRNGSGREEHFAIVVGDGLSAKRPLVRLHSQCLTGDVLGSLKCDCGEQLETALSFMSQEGGGVLLYLAQEGRDIGLLNKIRAYALQDAGLDTVEANHSLGFGTDERGFQTAAQMIKLLKLSKIRLLTNNPDKVKQLSEFGIVITQRLPLSLPTNKHNENYMKVKKEKTGHIF